MSAATLAQQGIEALGKRDWQGAFTLLDKALAEGSNSPKWLLGRAQANYQLKNYDAALRDSALAYHSATERANGDSRRHMITAQYRRSTVYFKLGRLADADCCAKWSLLLAEGRPAGEDDGVEKRVDGAGRYTVTYKEGLEDKANQPIYGMRHPNDVQTKDTGFKEEWARAYTWRTQVLVRLEALPADDPGRLVNVTKIPPKPNTKAPEKISSTTPTASAEKAVEKPAPVPGSVPDEKLKLRADFYQSNQVVSVSVFAKDLKKDDLVVEFSDNHVRISPLPREHAPYVKAGDREATSTFVLAENIDPSGSSWTATPRKIELKLKKATPGQKWATWGEEKIGDVGTGFPAPDSSSAAQPSAAAPAPVPAPVADKAPAYPTSSKKGPKDWEKLGADDAEEEPDEVNAFFKKLYKGATPEQQRAMMKSFTESNGTALSTDWSDVGGRTVETVPPSGVVPKKWES